MADTMSADTKLALINENLQEVLNPEIMEEVVKKGERPLKIYWGTATTGRPHCGYFVPMLKIAQFLQAGCHVKILLADIHAFLDNLKAPIELVNYRAKYYKYVITESLKAVGVSVDRLEFVLGSEYQKSPDYMMDLLRLSTMTTEHDAKRAGAEVVKQTDNPLLSGLIYPLMQALDEQYLDVDVQFGGVDQRKIFALAKEALPKLGYKERAHLMNKMVPGLQGDKMSSSDPDSKIDLLDGPDAVKRKLKKAFAEPRKIEGNGLLSFVEYVLLPAGALEGGKPAFTVERREGEPLVYNDAEKMKEDYAADVLTPQLLKSGVTDGISKLLAPIQAAFAADKEWQEIEKLAYPPVVEEKKKKEKKVKNKGSRYPGGAKNIEAQPDGSVEGKDAQEVSVGQSAEEALEKLDLAKQEVKS
ncbi:Aminoacyl-tRNA synthetase class Ib [Macrophomina phaseolina MS6]|uniref:Tyrosine--tRNA ligase n=2 Tax=Macrophomina phaseolina TaxID=35725 RepID=K2SLK3_MACPH|nr:Aminoacyl-tRNA synthetase class Ib [Macrophomina phaseolina MS6]KAH7064641.1 tyrosyl-tRNA synthetase [Macrophomina phaseolina]